MNHIVLMGRLTRDPEIRHTQSQTPVAAFTLAVDRGYTSGGNGERQTDFIDCVAWRGTAEFLHIYFKKGQMAAVAGRLQIRGWVDKDNNKRKSAEVIAERVYFAENKSNTGGKIETHDARNYNQEYAQPVKESEFKEIEYDEDDFPF